MKTSNALSSTRNSVKWVWSVDYPSRFFFTILALRAYLVKRMFGCLELRKDQMSRIWIQVKNLQINLFWANQIHKHESLTITSHQQRICTAIEQQKTKIRRCQAYLTVLAFLPQALPVLVSLLTLYQTAR